VAGGRGGDELVVGWFGSEVSGDPNDVKNVWRYYAATSFDGGESFDYATVTPNPIHYQDICTQGIFCGLIPGQPGNRNLADFSSVAVDPATGCTAIALPGDPENHSPGHEDDDNFSSHAYVAFQDGGPALTPNGGKCRGAGAKATNGPAPQGPANHVCGDRVAPRSSISHLSRATRRRVSFRGRSIDRVCSTGSKKFAFHGRVKRVTVAMSKRAGKRCRFLTAKGRLSRARSCRKPIRLRAKGHYLGRRTDKTAWTYRARVHIPRGRYRVNVRGIDAFGHVERGGRVFNTRRFVVR
jgi:hypothetical protein